MTRASAGRATVVHVITKLELGGAQETTLATARLLDRGAFDPVLVYGPGGMLDPEAAAIPGVRLVPCRDLVRPISPLRDALALLSLRRTIRGLARSGRPVVVHTHSSKAGILGRWAALLAGADAVVHTVHGFGFHPGQPLPARWLFVGAERLAARITDRLIFVSASNAREAEGLGIRARGGAELIRSALPVESFSPDRGAGMAWRRGEGIPEDVPLIGMVACLKPQKSPLDFVTVAALIAGSRPDARFVIAGDGVLRQDVERAAAAAGLGGRMRLLGWRRDVPDMLRALDCLALTSRWEGLPKAVVEGILSGAPVVANAVDGVSEVFERFGGGIAVAPGDVGAMGRAILGIVDGSVPVPAADRASLAREFDAAAMVRRHEALYRGLLGPSA